jgi:hypothetical protein
MFAIFSVVLPVAVGVVFFTFLWKKPFVLYAPADYPAHTPVGAFVDAVMSNRDREVEVLDAAVAAAAEQIVAAVTAGPSHDELAADTKGLIERAQVTAREEVESRTISIDTAGISPGADGQTLRFAADNQTKLGKLTNFVYFGIADYVQPYAYGKQWVLKDADSGTVYRDIGRQWAQAHGRRDDGRTLGEVGIKPGARLEVVPLEG